MQNKLHNLQAKPFFKQYGFCIGGFIGLCVFLAIYGPSTLNVTYDSWVYAGYVENDIVQSYAGWQYFRASPWHLPLGDMSNVAMPVGANIAHTDSLPLLAVFLKLFRGWLPQTFQYFGIINCANFILQGALAWKLVQLFAKNCWQIVFGTLLFCTMPIFVERAFRHSALGAQWFIVWALYVYFAQRRKGQIFWRQWGAMGCLAPLVHAYHLPLVLAVMAAGILPFMLKNKAYWQCVWRTAVCGVLCVFGCLLFGVFGLSGGNAASGYGTYSMNLNAFFNPRSFNFLADSYYDWSAFLPVLPQFYHNYDGFNYAGLGVFVALFAIACFTIYNVVLYKRGTIQSKISLQGKAFIKRNVWLLLACVFCTLFAVSNVVQWGESISISLPIPNFVYSLASMFRASGRMFYLVNYCIMLGLVVFVIRHASKKMAGILLAVVLALQIADTAPVLLQKHTYFAQEIVEQDVYATETLQWFAQNHDTAIELYSVYDYRLSAAFVRYNPQIKTNQVFFNRGNYDVVLQGYQEAFDFLISGAPLPEGTMYICESLDKAGQILMGLHENAGAYQVGNMYFITNIQPNCPLTPIPR